MSRNSILHWAFAALLCMVAAISPAAAQDQQSPGATSGSPLTVAVREVPPFAMKDASGNWTGLSVDLWQDVADGSGIAFEWREMPLEETLDALRSGEVDAAVAALSVTQEREATIDFSHPYYIAGLSTAYLGTSGGNAWLATLRNFASIQFLSAVASLALVLLVAGTLVWIFERKANAEEFGEGDLKRGLGNGFWWSAVTMTTVGYGDKSPRTLGGRVVALIWMFLSLIIVASFTASIAASLTANSLDQSGIAERPLSDLHVGTLGASAAEQFAQGHGARVDGFDDLDSALAALERGEIEAVLHDAPILRYEARQSDIEDLEVSNGVLIRDDYAFAFPEGSEVREEVNLALLSILFEPQWQDTRRRYLGEFEDQQM